MKNKTIFFYLLLILITFFSCSPFAHRPKQPPEKVEQRLLAATLQLIETPQTQPDIYEKKRLEFQQALSEYLQATGMKEQKVIHFVHGGTTIIVPVQMMGGIIPPRAELKDSPFILWETLGPPFRGEILDIAIPPVEQLEEISGFFLLFADSLVSYSRSRGERLSVFRFGEDTRFSTRSMYPAGKLQIMNNEDGQLRIHAITSHLKSPQIFRTLGIHLRPVQPANKETEFSSTQNWRAIEGQDWFTSAIHDSGFRVLQNISGTPFYALLDRKGFLHLKDSSSHESIWQSERPWGNRLEIPERRRPVVFKNRQQSVVMFRQADSSLKLVGQSPLFQGKISALKKIEFRERSGWLLGIVNTDSLNIPYSRIHYVPGEIFQWNTPVETPEPQFPDFEAAMTISVGSMETESAASRFYHLPSLVWNHIYETLFMKQGETVHPSHLVASVNNDSAGIVWNIRLNTGIRFSDNSTLTAGAVKIGWEQNIRFYRKHYPENAWLWNPITGSEKFNSGETVGLEGIEVLSESLLKINLQEARPRFPDLLLHPVFAVTKKNGRNKHPIGTGPFTIRSAVPSDRLNQILCEYNPYYHQGRPPLAEIHFLLTGQSLTDYFTRKEPAGMIIKQQKNMDFFRELETTRIEMFPEPVIYFLSMNPEAVSLNNIQKRLRVTAALDREIMARIIRDVECIPAASFFIEEYQPPENGNPDLRLPQPLRVYYRANDPIARQIAERLSARFSQENIAAQIPEGLSDRLFERVRQNGEYDILIDFFVFCFSHPSANINQLVSTGYRLADRYRENLNRNLIHPDSITYQMTEKLILDDTILYPLLRVKNLAILPASLQEVNLNGAGIIYFTRAWLPLK